MATNKGGGSTRNGRDSNPQYLGVKAYAGETSERQMMVYFPQHRLLYGSDPFQKQGDGSYFLPQTVSELTDAAARERLPVESFFMMHMGLTPWAELPAALVRAAATQTPDGKL